MWSSAAVAHLLQDSTCCVFRDGILHTLVVTSGYLSYCCLSIISNQSVHSPLTSRHFHEIVNWWVFVKCEPKIITIKRTKDLNYFSLCAFHLFNTQVSQFELNNWNKLTFPWHSNWRYIHTYHTHTHTFTFVSISFLKKKLVFQAKHSTNVYKSKRNTVIAKYRKSSHSPRSRHALRNPSKRICDCRQGAVACHFCHIKWKMSWKSFCFEE